MIIGRVCGRPVQRALIIICVGVLFFLALAVFNAVDVIGPVDLRREMLIRTLVPDEFEKEHDIRSPSKRGRKSQQKICDTGAYLNNGDSSERGHTDKNDSIIKQPVHSPKIAAQDIDGQTKVLILGYYRSGSTLTGSFFDSHPDTFYAFEPLYPLLQKSVRYRYPLTYFDGTSREPPTWDNRISTSIETLHAFYNCELQRIDTRTLTTGFIHKSKAFPRYKRCIGSIAKQVDFLNVTKQRCLPNLIERCKTSKIIVMKEIRVSMFTAEELLRIVPGLKIVHLLRDPRGMTCSKHPRYCAGTTATLSEHKLMCETIRQDIAKRLQIESLYPGRITDLKYEDLIVQPLKTVQKMFNFFNISFHSNVAKWIHTTTLSGMPYNGVLGAIRPDPVTTAYNWTKKISWELANASEALCGDVQKYGQFPNFQNLQQIREFKWPMRDLKKERMEIRKFVSA